MADNDFVVGSRVRVSLLFEAASTPAVFGDDPVWSAVDPAAVSVALEAPDGSVTTYAETAAELTNMAADGYYVLEWVVDQAGVWRGTATGAGTLDEAVNFELFVRERVG